MAVNDPVVLNQILQQRHQEVAPAISESEFFEIYSAEQILKDYDLSYDEIQAGIIAGSADGGIDSAYIFVNGELVASDSDLSGFKKDVRVDIVIIQSKTSDGFKELAIDKINSTLSDILNLGSELSDVHAVYNEGVIEFAENFRFVNKTLASRFPTLHFHICYATKGLEVHPNVRRKAAKLSAAMEQLFSSSSCIFDFVGASELLELARRAPVTAYSMVLSENPISSSGAVGYICLVKLSDFFDFITDDDRNLIRNIFEANVRDYQGEVQVNSGIQATLEGDQDDEFWWLNNGITILSSQATLSAKTLTIKNPQIVNGLQTSTEIFKHFKEKNTEGDERNVLVRVIVPTKSENREAIIKATNSQTKIPDASLRATEKIHRDIEDYLSRFGLFYDRRKNYYKNEGKPISRIIGITQLAQAVMSVMLRRPDNARARPSSLLKVDEDYNSVFNPNYPIEVYLVCEKLIKKVEDYLKSNSAELQSSVRNDIKFHMVMAVCQLLSKTTEPSPGSVASVDVDACDESVLDSVLNVVWPIYQELGETGQVAKGTAFPQRVIKAIAEKLAANE